MTRKDYVLIANAVGRTVMASDIGGTAKDKAAKRAALHLVTVDLEASLAHDNPAFDRERFRTACGFGR